MEDKKVLVYFTTYNEEGNIGKIVKETLDLGFECMVVDDGSKDKTIEVAEGMGATVLGLCINQGQSSAFLTGLKYGMYHNYDIVIHLDGDGQHRPSELPLFLRKIEETDADIVVGSRILGSNHPNAPFFRKVFLPYFTWLINKLTGYKMTDSMCGFRAYQRKALLKLQLNNMLEPEYLAPELFMRASKVRLKISEVPVTLEDRDHGESHKGCIRYGYGILKAMLVVFLDKTYHMKRE